MSEVESIKEMKGNAPDVMVDLPAGCKSSLEVAII